MSAIHCGIIAGPAYTAVSYPAAPTIVKTIQPASVVKVVQPAPAPVEYEFSYEVNNPETGDIKMQKESRKGDDVSGSYSLVEPDGWTRRIVDYTASEHGGFNAVVRKEQVQSPTVTKIIAPQPTITKVISPVPHVYHAAPQIHKVVSPAVTKVVSAPPASGHSFSSFQLSSPVVKYGW